MYWESVPGKITHIKFGKPMKDTRDNMNACLMRGIYLCMENISNKGRLEKLGESLTPSLEMLATEKDGAKKRHRTLTFCVCL